MRSTRGSSMPVKRSVDPRPPWQLPDPNGRKSVMQGFRMSVPSGWKTNVVPYCDSGLALPTLASPEQVIARRAVNATADSPVAATVGHAAVNRPPSEMPLLRMLRRKVRSNTPSPVAASGNGRRGPPAGFSCAPVFCVSWNCERPLNAPVWPSRSVKNRTSWNAYSAAKATLPRPSSKFLPAVPLMK